MSEFLEKMLAKRPKENVKRISMDGIQEFHKVIKFINQEDDSVETCIGYHRRRH